MLHRKEFVDIGFIRKAHGYKGDAKIVVEDHFLDDLLSQSFVFIEIDGYKVPFFIENLSDKKDILLKLEGIDSPEDLVKYHQHRIFLLKESLKYSLDYFEETVSTEEYTGMVIWTSDNQEVGRILRVEEYPHQLMAIVLSQNDEEILIPLHEELIVRTEKDKLIMDLPEGLF